MQDNKLIEDARSLTTVIASGTVDLSYEQIRGSFLKVVPLLLPIIDNRNAKVIIIVTNNNDTLIGSYLRLKSCHQFIILNLI